MKIRFNALMLGSFIIGAVLLAAVALLTVGARNPFRATGHFVLYLSDSALGLDTGTGVTLNGVPIGQVEEIRVIYEQSTRRSKVYVLCRIDHAKINDVQGRPIRLTDERVLEDLVKDGLRAQVATAGVVGAKSINLGFYDPSEYPLPSGLPPSRYPIVPLRPSTMDEITKSASQIMENLRKTDFAAISRKVQDVLTSVRQQVGELETNRMTDHISDAAASIDKLAASTNIQAVLLRAQDLITNVNAQVSPLSGKATETLASINQTAQELQDFVALRDQLGEQTHSLVEQLTQTARTVERLAGYLEAHPNALLTGRTQTAETQ